ncbi:Septin Spn4 [Schizosaccharomyces pombe]|uniref:Septin homolog spn4 n=1 Tax=Schizosaccharomyces pombe (strain 972 / ATCC 24843) TaxID=284812 RepID=SPN4_SCHPO|nr:septin Spn4 [Schizosaccharomyces pombe]P48009.1 RecName: Full=Septin homolog spn4 [Schizosaccharomyces pombe 972h-]AAB53689.1 septin homolog [Schizosaccharomyces pombe]CAB11495.1 septin Spn4 [Schizosaccharomyces pombe]|eukprot:NP_001342848.1 septin Spn4 [Schizosaccharomyces pombe]
MNEEETNFVGIADLPNQRHKIVSRNGVAFTLMLCGESGLGKTTFCNTLFSTTIKSHMGPEKVRAKHAEKTVEIEITKAELEEKNFHLRLTVIDTPGFGDFINNSGCWESVVEFIEDQHESYMRQDQQPDRRKIIDMRIHACLYFLRPVRNGVRPMDLEAMKHISKRVNLIPVIAKADMYTRRDLALYKTRISQVLEYHQVNVYKPNMDEGDPVFHRQIQGIINCMPFAIVGSEDDIRTPDGRVVKGREYPWGIVEIENEEHCDFKQLRNILIRSCMLDLIQTTEEKLYEQYRQEQMKVRQYGEPKLRTIDNAKFKEEEENLRKRFTEQVRVEETRFRQWEQRLIAERDSLNKDLEAQHVQIKQIELEIERLKAATSSRKR